MELSDEQKAGIKDIQNHCKKIKLPLGDALLMINKNYGWTWGTIPLEKYGEIKLFLDSNCDDRMKIIDHDYYIALQEHVKKYGIDKMNKDQVIMYVNSLIKDAFNENRKGT